MIYHPLGGRVIVVSTTLKTVGTLSGWAPCPWPVTAQTPAAICRTISRSSFYTPVEFRMVDIATGTEKLAYTIDAGSIRRLAADESGREMVLFRTGGTDIQTFRPGSQYGQYETVTSGTPATTCPAEVRDLNTGALKTTLPGVSCFAHDHGMFFAPSRMPAPR